MNVTFYGAVREVTGSMHLLSTGTDRILLDCGLFQGRRKETAEKNRILPVDPNTITNLLLSHAHIDHSGRIPMLTKGGFNGRIICTRATADACGYLLLDSAHIQESDANYLNYKTARAYLAGLKTSTDSEKGLKRKDRDIKKRLKTNRHKLNTETIDRLIEKHLLKGVRPLYTLAEAEQSLNCFDGYPYNSSVTIGQGLTCTFYDAGHILGSAISMIKAIEDGRCYTICYTGDIGRFGSPIIKDPTTDFSEKDRHVDLMIMESTYGNRFHEPVEDLKSRLKQVLVDTVGRSGSVLIPAFAYGRTQELLYVLHELYNDGGIPRIPIYVDSPLAANITRVFGEHPEVYDNETHETFLRKSINPFYFEHVRFVGSVQESMELMRSENPHIVLAASGMCEAGRILHHLRYKIHQPRNTILIVGYMAENTLGRRILELGGEFEKSGGSGPPPLLKFFNKTYPLKARVVKLGGFSAHADKKEMLRFLKKSNLKIKKIAVVHGEQDQSVLLAKHLEHEGLPAIVPKPGETVQIY